MKHFYCKWEFFMLKKGYPAEVGAIDSFLETLLSLFLQEKDPKEALDKACAIGALVAQKKEVNPEITEKMLGNFVRQSI